MNRSRDHLRDVAAVALLCCLVIACTWRIALAGRVLAGGDIFSYFYPYWAEATRAIRAARLPLWNPVLFMGVPFVGNSQVGFFYPLNWPLWLLLSAHRSVHLTIVLHLCLAGLNAYLWGRTSLRLGRVASWVVGAMVALGGYMGAQMEHVNQLQGLAWLPLLLTLTDRIVRPRPSDHGSDGSWLGGRSGWVRNPAGRGSRIRGEPGRGCEEVASAPGRLRACCLLAIVTAMVLLAGHTQTAFISLFGVAVYALVPELWRVVKGAGWGSLIRGAVPLGVGAVLGVALAAVQLLPTWELSQLSVRAGGLPFNERVSFSLSPLYVGRALLPAFGGMVPLEHIEHVAYVGVTGLALAMAGLLIDPGGSHQHRGGVHRSPGASHLLILLGLFFALGLYNPVYILLARYVPGFAHFRVPARWLALYGVGVAALAGRAVQTLWEAGSLDRRHALIVAGLVAVLILWALAGAWLSENGDLSVLSVIGWAGVLLGSTALLLVASRYPRLATIGLSVLLAGELVLASGSLPQARATAPQAFTSLRPAIAHLLASERARAGPSARFLSMSDTTFDPGDLSLIRSIYGTQLSEDQLYDYVVATKQKEILSPNLPLAFGVPAVDGYDGGLLPLQRYVTLQRAFLSAEDVSIDGRLRENLEQIPEGRWLSLFNVRSIITDKLRDAWVDDVFYDLQFGAQLSAGEAAAVAELPTFEATALGVVSHLEDDAALADGTPVGVVRVGFADGQERSFVLRAGEDVRPAVRGQPVEDAMVTRLRWSEPVSPLTVTVEATIPQGSWAVRGLSLIDERTSSFQSLILSDQGRFRLVHSGDVKVYENLDVLPRAFVVHQARMVSDDGAGLQALQEPAFDLSSQVVLGGSASSCGSLGVELGTVDLSRAADTAPSASATIVAYRPERVVIEAALDRPGVLVLTDAYYPGWQARVDSKPVPVCPADLLFRGVTLEPGEHRVVFSFRPPLQRLGLVISLLAVALLVMVWHAPRIVESGVRCYNDVGTWSTDAEQEGRQ